MPNSTRRIILHAVGLRNRNPLGSRNIFLRKKVKKLVQDPCLTRQNFEILTTLRYLWNICRSRRQNVICIYIEKSCPPRHNIPNKRGWKLGNCGNFLTIFRAILVYVSFRWFNPTKLINFIWSYLLKINHTRYLYKYKQNI